MDILWELLDSQTLISILLDNVHCKDSYIDVEVHDVLMWVQWLAMCWGMTFHHNEICTWWKEMNLWNILNNPILQNPYNIMLIWYVMQVLTLLQFGECTFVQNSSDLLWSFGFTSKCVLIGFIFFQVYLRSPFVPPSINRLQSTIVYPTFLPHFCFVFSILIFLFHEFLPL
jgi:hypothetical protein